MMRGLAILLGLLLAGELTAHALRLPLPGSVLGMALLLGWLWNNGRVPDDLGEAAGALLANMPLLFVPVGVGAMVHFGLFQSQWLLIALAVIGCTLLTIGVTAAVTGWVYAFSAARQAPKVKRSSMHPVMPDLHGGEQLGMTAPSPLALPVVDLPPRLQDNPAAPSVVSPE